MRRTTAIPPAAVDALRRTVDGLVAYPTDPAYDAALSDPHAPHVRPDVVVVPATELAAAAAVDVARAHGLRISGPTSGDEPVMIVLTHRLVDVDVDPRTATATVGAGVTWADLETRALDSGLAPQHPGPDAPRGVVASACAGVVDALAVRVVQADGFVHVVDDPRPAPGQAQPWIVTAVIVRLRPLTTSTTTPSTTTHATNERMPS
ncbi:FAD-binding protein [Nocardioides baculatus]|uniref:FAD-binding oxidoreductase n=1 Tax=Nocardioides baculatus TaxID=2801337 RepID=A0ABS1L654_9ACTN|nr:FAD-binding protein [Nocardioides baculatus]MBL0746987.1 FAD-binding oxidoreductase [Nocardioides baculatus]